MERSDHSVDMREAAVKRLIYTGAEVFISPSTSSSSSTKKNVVQAYSLRPRSSKSVERSLAISELPLSKIAYSLG